MFSFKYYSGLVLFVCVACSNFAWAQSEAILGESIGVGCIVVPMNDADMPQPLGLEGVQIYEQNNRVLYPVIEVREVPKAVTETFQNARRPIGRFVGQILEQTGSSVAIYFLFTGNQPLNITIAGNRPIQRVVMPVNRPVRYRGLLQEWWARYNKDASPFVQTNDYPPVVKEYLRTMLSFRMGLTRPEQKPAFYNKLFYTELGFQFDPTISLFETQRNLFFAPEQYRQKADQPLPSSLGELIAQHQSPISLTPKISTYQPVSYTLQGGEAAVNETDATNTMSTLFNDPLTPEQGGDMVSDALTKIFSNTASTSEAGAEADVTQQPSNATPSTALPLEQALKIAEEETAKKQSAAKQSSTKQPTVQQPAIKPPTSKQPDEGKSKGGSLWDSLTQGFSQMTGRIAETMKTGPDTQTQFERAGVEPLAFHVPAHCFYIRFGSYSNFQWFQDTTALWGGDMRTMIAMRGLNTRTGARLEQQIGLRTDALAKLFGDSVIDDVAVIGFDLFFEEGASFGLLFRAKNSTTLASDFKNKRATMLRENQQYGATETTIDMQGQKVSFISTPDQRIRTFYVAMGNYHLVTRSEQLVRDFIALHSQQPEPIHKHRGDFKMLSLGELDEYQQIRNIIPTTREETIFLYFSRPYFYNIVSPAYWVETQRRDVAAAGIELVRLGSMAASAEGRDNHDNAKAWVQTLKVNGYIPPNFGRLPDGSETVLESWSDIHDSRRGYRGSFVPIADLLPTRITTAESQAYQKMCQMFFEKWGNLDPVVISIIRQPMQQVGNNVNHGNTAHTVNDTRGGIQVLEWGQGQGRNRGNNQSQNQTQYQSYEQGLERIIIDARMAPLSRKNADTLRQNVGQAMVHEMAPVQGNIMTFEASLASNFFFGALQNDVPPRENTTGPLGRPRPIESVERLVSGIVLQDQSMVLSDLFAGYLGIIGQPGQIVKTWDRLFLKRDDAAGYSRDVIGSWRRHFGQYTFYSRHRAILEAIAPQLGFYPAEYAAQLRIRAGNPLPTRIAPVLNNLGYSRTRNTSLGNLRLLNDLQMQFLISGPHCKEVAEQILDAELVCPLGGAYQFQPSAPGQTSGRWIATAVVGSPNNGPIATQAPRGFIAPPLNWFRGAQVDVLVAPDAVSIHTEIDMVIPKK